MERFRPKRVDDRGGLGARVAALETRMTSAEAGIIEAATAATAAAVNTAELLAIANGVKGVAGFMKKHGPRMIAFAFGIASAAGIGNPKVMAFISSFFGV